MIQQLIEIRNNILSAIEANDNILAKMAINDLDTLLYKVSQEEKEKIYNEKEVKRLIHLACSHSGIQVFKGFDKWFDKNKK
jgi:hypothetical protein